MSWGEQTHPTTALVPPNHLLHLEQLHSNCFRWKLSGTKCNILVAGRPDTWKRVQTLTTFPDWNCAWNRSLEVQKSRISGISNKTMANRSNPKPNAHPILWPTPVSLVLPYLLQMSKRTGMHFTYPTHIIATSQFNILLTHCTAQFDFLVSAIGFDRNKITLSRCVASSHN